MRVCAIVLNYRDAARTEECLRSLSRQGIGSVILVDNSADDRAAAELAVRRQRLEGMDYVLHSIDPGCNLGFARGVNRALADAAAEHCDAFLLINNDAVALPGMVAALTSALEHGDVVLAAPVILNVSDRPQPMFWYQRFTGLMTAWPLPGSFPYPSGCCLMFRRELLENGRLFDEDFFMYGEDTLLGWRLMREGRRMRRVEEAAARHADAGASRHGGLFYEYHMARAHWLLAVKTKRHALELPLLLPGKCAMLLARASWRSLRFGSLTPLRGLFMALAGSGKVMP